MRLKKGRDPGTSVWIVVYLPTMAFVVPARGGRFEIRESRSTPDGPRSRTLASFTELTADVLAKAAEKAERGLDFGDLRRSARRAGAPVAAPPVERAARELIAELAKGRRPSPSLRRILLELLQRGCAEGAEPSPENDAARGAAMWMAADAAERGRALFDLLLLADAVPAPTRRRRPLRFPKLESGER